MSAVTSRMKDLLEGKQSKAVAISASFQKLEDLVFETQKAIVALKKDADYDDGHEHFLKAAAYLTETANKLNLASMTFDLGVDALEDDVAGR